MILLNPKICMVGAFAITLVGFNPMACHARPQANIVLGKLPKSVASQLELQIRSIDLRGLTMEDALDELAKDIFAASHGRCRFQFLTEYSREREYLQKGVPAEKWKRHNPSVEVHLQNTTLRRVIDYLCKQAGWSYAQSRGQVRFIDDSRYFSKRKISEQTNHDGDQH